jgi:hypothetical protein
MPITLTPRQMLWLEGEVAAGRYSSIEDAAQAIISAHIFRATNDPAWASSLVDQVRNRISQADQDVLAQLSAFMTSREGQRDA